MDGSDLHLDFNVDWARAAQLLPAGIKEIPQGLSDLLLKLEMRGKIGDVHIAKVPVPAIVEPMKNVLKGK